MTEDEKDAAAAMVKLHEDVEELINGAVNKAFAEAKVNDSYGRTDISYAYILKALFDKYDAMHELHKVKIKNLDEEITRLKALTVGGR